VDAFQSLTQAVCQLAEARSWMSVSATTEARVAAELNTYFETLNNLNGLLADKLNSFLSARTQDTLTITRRTALITARQLADVRWTEPSHPCSLSQTGHQ